MSFIPRRLLITGGAGFILSHVVDTALAKWPEVRVVVLDKMDYCANVKNLKLALDTGRCALIQGDVCNVELVRYLLRSKCIDSVIHGAAMSHVDLSFGDSLAFTSVNTLGTHTMLECVKNHNDEQSLGGQTGIERFIYICTDEVYGSNSHQCDESSYRRPTNPYAASKSAASDICHSYIKSYGLPIIETRGNNTIGPRQYPEKLIPKFVHLLMQGKKLTIHGKGKAKRSFIDVLDCAEAIVTVLERGKIHEIYNIEADVELSVMEMTRKLLQEFGVEEKEWDKHITYVEDRTFNDSRYWISGEKLKGLGFKPRYELKDTLARIVAWYRKNANWWPNIAPALEAHPKLINYKVA